MADLRVITLNVRGLNHPAKRRMALHDLQRALRSSVVFLQETHFRNDTPPTLTSRLFPDGFFSNYLTAKSRGTAILFSRDVPFQLEDQLIDPEGRYLFIKGTISDTSYTFASVYLPNMNQHRCLARIIKRLTSFSSGILILAGDFNVADILHNIRRLESQSDNVTDASFQETTLLRRRLNEILDEKIRLDAMKAKCRFALSENKPGRLLAILLRQRRRLAYIAKIKLKKWTMLHSTCGHHGGICILLPIPLPYRLS
uniref:exodeoxyribonuclease III n=1 Tax=Leptobrachium leishanense TaxID=445787 RepID=A0A8C5MTK2_9ANUR